MHGAASVWIRVSVLKIKVFGLVSDLERFHSPLQNICIMLQCVGPLQDSRDQDRGALICEENAPFLNTNSASSTRKGSSVVH